MNTIEKAREFAARCHGVQLYGKVPYIKHLEDVYRIAKSITTNENIHIAAFLHDVIEDTKCTYQDVVAKFGKEVAELVYAVTDEIGRNRVERKEKTYPKIAESADAITLKICDRLANFEAAHDNNYNKYEMYSEEHFEFCVELNLCNLSEIDAHRIGFEKLEAISRIKREYI